MGDNKLFNMKRFREENDDLVNAIKIIRTTCKKHDRCSKCPLRSYNNDGCRLQMGQPANWKLKEEDESNRIFA